MGTAFTPGLTVSACVTIRKTRRLPVRGSVVVAKGAHVNADTIVARVDVPGPLAVVKAAALLGCSPERLAAYTRVTQGAVVKKDQLLAERKVFFGLSANRARSPIDGTVEYISHLSGNIGVRGLPTPLVCRAYIAGTVVEILPEEGVVIETCGALAQGIFGVGGERHGTLVWLDNQLPLLRASDITAAHRGCIVMHPGRLEAGTLDAAVHHGLAGLVGASIVDQDLMRFLGYDIGVAITGEEDIPFSLMLTEGFGDLVMPEGTRRLLHSLSGAHAAMNGATQIRAGVIRPELIVPRANAAPVATAAATHELRVGTRVRLIRRPHFGALGAVTALPEQPVQIETGSYVRVATVQLDNGSSATVPRANLEILAT